MATAKETITRILDKAGVAINGSNPWDIQVHNENFYTRALAEGTMGIGEAYMDGWWDCDALDQMISRVVRADVAKDLPVSVSLVLLLASSWLINRQTLKLSKKIVKAQYDLGNDFYEPMLGRTMGYTCGYWSGSPPAKNLDEAQEAKFDLVCRKIGLQKGHRVLDIGCGWGGFAKHAAEKYGAEVVGVTISGEQVKYAIDKAKGLPVEFRMEDYRAIQGEKVFDRIVSIGMVEHVGLKNYRTYFEIANRALKDDGLFLLHTMGESISTLSLDPWFDKYVLPNSLIPSLSQISSPMNELFVVEDMHNFGTDYHPTLLAWYENFNKSWPQFKDRYGERFYRMWKYYLLLSAGGCHARRLHLWQFALSKKGIVGGYKTVR